MKTSFFGELLQTITERSRALLDRAGARRDAVAARSENLVELCEDLLSRRGEASGVALAREILDTLRRAHDRPAHRLLRGAGDPVRAGPRAARPPRSRTGSATRPTRRPPRCTRRPSRGARSCSAASTWRPAAPPAWSTCASSCSTPWRTAPISRAVDADFVHLFSSWFNRGFLVLRRIDWSTPAIILEKIIRYEAVHRIRGWDDLRRRIDPPDRRCYAFFHPALVDDPLIFVEVAVTREIPTAIAPILTSQRDVIRPDKATTAVFYSISNCQRGLTGVTFGHFLIKQVAEEISREIPNISTFVTLSPVPGFAAWLARERAREVSTVLEPGGPRGARRSRYATAGGRCRSTRDALRDPLMRAAAWYFLHARNRTERRVDPVARFHLGNGARLEQIDWLADTSTPRRRPVARPDGELPLRPQEHREEPRGLCGEPHHRGGERGEAARCARTLRGRAGAE